MNNKILITSPSLNTDKNIGGISNLTKLLIDKNKEVIYRHFVVGKEDAQERNLTWIISQFKKWLEFNKILRRENIDVVHINIPLGKFSIIINYTLVIIAKLNQKKVISHIRGGRLSLNRNVSKLQKLVIKHSLKMSNKIILLGEKEMNFIEDFYNIDSSKLVVLPNAVTVPETNIISDKITNRIADDKVINILFIGRIDKNKGLEEIVIALEILKRENVSFRFHLAGTGPEEDWFVDECSRVLGNQFIHHGVIGYEEKSTIFMETDIFLLPSYFEGMPNGMLETMAYGAVAVCTPVGSIPEVIIDNDNGILVDVKKADQIAERIVKIIANKKKRMEMSINAHETMKNNYSLDSYMNKLNQIYNKVIEIV